MIVPSHPGYMMLDDEYRCLGCSTNLESLLRVPPGVDLLECAEKGFLPLFKKVAEAAGSPGPAFHRVALRSGDSPFELLVFVGATQMVEHKSQRMLIIMDADSYRDLKEQLWDSNLAETIRSLAPGFAHTLRNPLNSMAVTLFVLKESLPADIRESAARYLQVLQNDLNRIDGNIDDIISFLAPDGAWAGQEVDVSDLVTRLPKLIRHELTIHGARVNVDLDERPLRIPGDPRRLTQIILNVVRHMLSLAREIDLKASREGDKVELHFTARDTDGSIADRPRGSYHRAAKERLLVVSEDIVESMGGSFRVDSDADLKVSITFEAA